MIDLILVRKRWKSSVLNTVSLAGVDFDSDHVLVMSEICMLLQKPQTPKKSYPKYRVDLLKNIETRNKYKTALSNKLSSIQLTGVPTTEEVDRLVDESTSIIRETANEILGVQSRSDKPWITPEIIDICAKNVFTPTNKTNKARVNTRG